MEIIFHLFGIECYWYISCYTSNLSFSCRWPIVILLPLWGQYNVNTYIFWQLLWLWNRKNVREKSYFSRNVLGENINFTKIRQTSSTSLMTLQFVILSLFLFKGVILVLNKLLKSQTYSIWWVAGLVHKRADLYLAVPLSWFPFWSLLSTWNLHIGPVTMWSLPGCALFLLSSQTRRLIASQQG